MDIAAPLRKWLYLGCTIALLGIAVFVISYCSDKRKLRESEDRAEVSEGRTVSAVEAITEIGKLDDRGQATDKEVQDAQEAIRNAPAADRDRIARHRLCLLQHRSNCDGLLNPR